MLGGRGEERKGEERRGEDRRKCESEVRRDGARRGVELRAEDVSAAVSPRRFGLLNLQHLQRVVI